MTQYVLRVERRADIRRIEPLSRRIHLAALCPTSGGDDRRRRSAAA